MLSEEFDKSTSSFVVIHGRRRIGKSRLIQEFGKNLKTLHFSGMPPTRKTTDENQRNEFATQMAQSLNMPIMKNQDWSNLFWFLAKETANGKWLVVLDEISWMGSKDPDFLGKLKNAWDLHFSQNPKLMLIVCGSVSSWIERNILSNTGFLGRISLDIVLEELPLHDCLQFWGNAKTRISPYEIYKVLSVTGGVPKYLEEIRPSKSAEDNIENLCFKASGLLYREFEQIFSDLFSKKSEKYRKIVSCLVDHALSLSEICALLKLEKSGVVSSYLSDLEDAGFISSDWTWNLKSNKISTLRKYRLSDNYLRFYLKYIHPIKELIATRNYTSEPLCTLPNWSTVMGYQFENLVITNRLSLYHAIDLNPAKVYVANPFFQRKTARKKGCQIDYLIQTKSRTLFLVEIKFSGSQVGPKVIEEVKEKIARLSVPKGFSIRPVLVHVNGVTDAVLDARFFDHIVDFAKLLKN